MNFGSRITPGEPRRTRLVVDTISGPILANSAHPGDYPDDPNEPWVHGGRSWRGIAENLFGITTGGEYFLSPPPQGPLWITVAYPEFGLTSTTIEFGLPQLL